jgi:hypothetical protein
MTTATRKLISRNAALDMLRMSHTGVSITGMGAVRIVKIAEPFVLIVVEGAQNGVNGEAGDYIGLHPNGYPFVVDRRIAE